MALKKILQVIIFCGLINSSLCSQGTNWKNRLYIESNYHYGFLMPHSEYISFFVQDHIQGFQLNIGLLANGEKYWHQSYNFPKLGVGFYHSGLGNNNVYGQVNALFAYVDRYYLNWKRRFNFGNRLSLGGAFINKRFDLNNNSNNLAIGSHLNAYVNYCLETVYRFTPQTEIKLGAGITHVSNGNYRQPNKGLNFCTFFGGFSYSFNEPNRVNSPVVNIDSSHNNFLIMALYGRKQISRKLDNTYSVSGVSVEYSHLITGNSWGGTAVTFYYDPSLIKEINMSDTVSHRLTDKVRVTLNLSYELKMGRISYVFQPGFYLKNPYKGPGNISNRLSVRYQISKTLTAGLTIKAHWFAIADFFEWGIGYRFMSKK